MPPALLPPTSTDTAATAPRTARQVEDKEKHMRRMTVKTMTERVASRLATVAMIAAAGLTSAGAQGGSTLHGDLPPFNVNSACSLSQQIGGAAGAQYQLKTRLQTLINGVDPATADTRDLTNGSLANIEINGSSVKPTVVTWVKRAYSSLDSGNNVWFNIANQPATGNDPNASEFATLGLGVMMAGGKLTIADLNDAPTADRIALVMKALAQHTAGSSPAVKPDYTNMYLMNTTARILMDQGLMLQGYNTNNLFGATGYDPQADLNPAETQMVTYLTQIKTVGIHEFDSPVYSGTQLESLVMGFRYASDGNTKKNYTTALDYLWLDLAANWHATNLRLAAPYSRNYKFMAGGGGTQVWTEVIGCWTTGDYIAGTGTKLIGTASLETAELYDILGSSHGYQLQPSTYQLGAAEGTSTANTRSVYQKWSVDKDGNLPTRTANIGKNAAIGCASGHYGPQDTLFGGSLSGDQSNAVANLAQSLISSVLDSSGSPYGTIQYPNGIHSKTEHLQANVACAFSGNVGLVSFNIDGSNRNDAPADTGLSTNIIFPVDTTNLASTALPQVAINNVAISGMPCTAGTGNTKACQLTMGSSVVTFKGKNNGVIGIKFLESGWNDTTNAVPQYPYQLEIDKQGSVANPDGNSNKASRIVVTHSSQSLVQNPTPPKQFLVTFLVAMEDGATSATNVYNTLSSATFTDNQGIGDPSKQVLKVVFPSNKPTDAMGNTVNGLQIVRSRATLTDIGAATEDIGSGFNALQPVEANTDTLYTVDGTHVKTSQSTAFWTQTKYAILNPAP